MIGKKIQAHLPRRMPRYVWFLESIKKKEKNGKKNYFLLFDFYIKKKYVRKSNILRKKCLEEEKYVK